MSGVWPTLHVGRDSKDMDTSLHEAPRQRYRQCGGIRTPIPMESGPGARQATARSKSACTTARTGTGMFRSSSKMMPRWSNGSSTPPMASRSACRPVSGYGGLGLRAPTPSHRVFPRAARIVPTGGLPRYQRSRGLSPDVGAADRLNPVWGEASNDHRATPPSADAVHLPEAQALPRDRVFGPYTHQYSQGIEGLRRLFRSDSI